MAKPELVRGAETPETEGAGDKGSCDDIVILAGGGEGAWPDGADDVVDVCNSEACKATSVGISEVNMS